VNLEQIQITKRVAFFTWLASFFGVVLLNPTKKVGGQVNFTKTFENKEFERKLINYFLILLSQRGRFRI